MKLDKLNLLQYYLGILISNQRGLEFRRKKLFISLFLLRFIITFYKDKQIYIDYCAISVAFQWIYKIFNLLEFD
ncbi:uncharacterized protein OCT59_014000 [Rhizophagus irregularis]|uniref:Uncharacterized protein n=1 Tax=Rhizophagus irregularis TaxID=588596 RepID=A0A915Z3H6_9GLOM|nr:hypothetical protein OCT59_014000 [Rhizophagus irregularis]GBC23087.1 hypothetical protein RIR_jg19713.t1 [Rhizophagus irregularis DAOM 181602=DAOM 197198]CAB4467478.1 unnamed protein product [Rhizophagus irregularis]CAB5215973.1 unnamed protein product [Rhizophagus irregularis]CAB5360308.1 unnamed protein product [Rhizophagus irregularis]